ncbi:MAG: hypothetical protein GX760_01225 [Erysipelothrix sp.]|nr:hypothetical protein [Erysipelothrix sp.]
MNLNQLSKQSDLKQLTKEELLNLVSDIRKQLYFDMSKTGGYLASNLSVVELTIALHYVYNLDNDALIFDGDRHTRIHQMLLNRYNKQFTSSYNAAISIAFGMSEGLIAQKKESEVVAILGDGSINDGINFEALKHLSERDSKVTIIYNDNSNSDLSVGNFDRSLNSLRVSKPYNVIKNDMSKVLGSNVVGKRVLSSLNSIKSVVKNNVLETTIFREFGIEYLGPIDGHNLKQLFAAFKYAKSIDTSIIIHVITKKGRGYKVVEEDPSMHYDALRPYDLETTKPLSKFEDQHMVNAAIVEQTLLNIKKQNKELMVVATRNLPQNQLINFGLKYAKDTFVISNSELHATGFAAGLALKSLPTFLALSAHMIPSLYNQINNMIAANDLPLVMGINNAGLQADVNSDYQGVYDINVFTSIPNLIVMQAQDQNELQNLLASSFTYKKPVAIRYSNAMSNYTENTQFEMIKIGTWTKAHYTEHMDAIIITYGDNVQRYLKRIIANNFNIGLINARFIKPLDETMLLELAALNLTIYIVETDVMRRGLSALITKFYRDHNLNVKIKQFSLKEMHLQPNSIMNIRNEHRLDINTILKEIIEAIERG